MPGPAPTRTAPATLRPRISLGEVRSLRYRLPDGHRTTVHVATYPRAEVTLRLVELEPPQPLASWCTRSGVADALVAGFFVTPDGPALGEVWIGGRRRPSRPMDPRWAPLRGCLAVDDGTVAMAPRHALPAVPRGGSAPGRPPARRGRAGARAGGGRPRGILGDPGAVRLRRRRRAAPAGGRRDRGRLAGGHRERGPLCARGRAHPGGAGRPRARSRVRVRPQPRRRRVDEPGCGRAAAQHPP